MIFFLALGAASQSPAAAQQIQVQQPKLYRNSLEAAQKALEHYGSYEDPAELERVTDIGYRLAVVSDFASYPLSFYLIDMPEPNAFALPGGQIFVTRGMLHLGLDDDMLACLLGHELAHVIHRHGTRMQRRATLLGILSQVLTLGVLVGADGGADNPRDPYGIDRSPSRRGSLVQGAAATGMVIGELLLRNYSRDFEDEADESGQRLAAAAGFDPSGARQLWELMTARIPQSKDYGYWRTHPFSDQRMRAAQVRSAELKIQQGRPSEDYRALTQKVVLDFSMRPDIPAELQAFLDTTALSAWPKGRRAEELRLAKLHRQRDSELEKKALERDYGALVQSYLADLDAVRTLTPDSPFLASLREELDGLRQESTANFPKALEVLEGGFYQTPFLEVFISNYPTAPQVPEVALALGDAYSRLGRQNDAVGQYLRASESGVDSAAGRRAHQGLLNLAPHLTRLDALQQLSDYGQDEALSRLATERLSELATTFSALSVGAEYLRRYPEGEHAEIVHQRLETLARDRYGEVVLYQGIGDHVKALERIQEILTHAPTSKAAELLRDRAVIEG